MPLTERTAVLVGGVSATGHRLINPRFARKRDPGLTDDQIGRRMAKSYEAFLERFGQAPRHMEHPEIDVSPEDRLREIQEIIAKGLTSPEAPEPMVEAEAETDDLIVELTAEEPSDEDLATYANVTRDARDWQPHLATEHTCSELREAHAKKIVLMLDNFATVLRPRAMDLAVHPSAGLRFCPFDGHVIDESIPALVPWAEDGGRGGYCCSKMAMSVMAGRIRIPKDKSGTALGKLVGKNRSITFLFCGWCKEIVPKTAALLAGGTFAGDNL
jgi:hypothetical protein